MPPLSNPLSVARTDVGTIAGNVAFYSSSNQCDYREAPLLLIHSVNAAASAFEVKPLFDFYMGKRPVYAMDLPGFGQSDRSDRAYTVQVMTNAIAAIVMEIRRLHACPIDAIALSLSCEFLARAAVEKPEDFRTIGLISPTGFEGKAMDKSGATQGKEWLRRTLNFSPWSHRLFSAFTAKPVIRKFLEKTFGSKKIDQALLNYDYETAHQPGAEHAPYYFISGHLFSKDILNVYQALTPPVWMVRGTRGDFVDYHHVSRVEDRSNWTFDVLDTGAFPHFEKLSEVTASYQKFLMAAGDAEKFASDTELRSSL